MLSDFGDNSTELLLDPVNGTVFGEFFGKLDNYFYGIPLLYLILTAFALLWFLLTAHFRFRKSYRDSLFFWIYTVDVVASLLLISLDLLVVRLFLYTPQLLSKWSELFIRHSWLNHIIFPIYHYLRAAKPVAHSALMLSRLYSVHFPIGYEQRSAQKMHYFLPLVIFLPLLTVVDAIYSKKTINFMKSGFLVTYSSGIPWLTISQMQVIFLILAIIIHIITTILIIRKLPAKTNQTEFTVIFTSGFQIIGYLAQLVFLSHDALFPAATWFPEWIVYYQFLIYDFLTVGNPIIMVIFAKELRGHFFSCSNERKQSMELKELQLKEQQNEKRFNIKANFDDF